LRTRRPERDVSATVVVAADGVNSFLAKRAGLRGELRADEVSLGVKEVVALDRQAIEDRFALNGDEGVTYESVGAVSGGVKGGAFLYTNRESLSLGVIAQVASLAEPRVAGYAPLEGVKAHAAALPPRRAV